MKYATTANVADARRSNHTQCLFLCAQLMSETGHLWLPEPFRSGAQRVDWVARGEPSPDLPAIYLLRHKVGAWVWDFPLVDSPDHPAVRDFGKLSQCRKYVAEFDKRKSSKEMHFAPQSVGARWLIREKTMGKYVGNIPPRVARTTFQYASTAYWQASPPGAWNATIDAPAEDVFAIFPFVRAFLAPTIHTPNGIPTVRIPACYRSLVAQYRG